MTFHEHSEGHRTASPEMRPKQASTAILSSGTDHDNVSKHKELPCLQTLLHSAKQGKIHQNGGYIRSGCIKLNALSIGRATGKRHGVYNPQRWSSSLTQLRESTWIEPPQT